MSDSLFKFVLPLELREKLRVYAKSKDLSIAQIVRAAIREYLVKAEVKDEEGKL